MSTIHGWDETTKHAESAGRFLRLKSGEKVVVAFRGEPCAVDRVFLDERAVAYDPKVHGNAKRSARFFINVYVVAENKVKIMEGSKPWYILVCAMRKKYGLDGFLFEVSRTGEGFKTQYNIMYEGPCPPDVAGRMAEHALHDLDEAIAEDEVADAGDDGRSKATASSGASGASAGARGGASSTSAATAATATNAATAATAATRSPSEPMIDAATAEPLRKALLLLSPELRQEFKNTFAASRLGDIPLAKLDEVRAWLDAQAEI